MNTPPKVTAVVTIGETNEVVMADFVNVVEMLESVLANVNLAELVFGRQISMDKCDIEGDVCKLMFNYVDTGVTYMNVVATRHTAH